VTDRIRKAWQLFAGLAAVLLIFLSVFIAGMGTMYWLNRTERMQLVDRIPVVRDLAAASAADAKYGTQISGPNTQNKTLEDSPALIKKSVEDTHKMVAEMTDFMHKRADINDRRNAAITQQVNKAASVATTAVQKTEVVVQKQDAQAQKTDAVKQKLNAVDNNLKTVVHPPLPAQPWAGNRRWESTMTIGTILLIVILLLIGAVPSWPHSRAWGYGPSGFLGVVFIVVIVLLLMGRL
jgi:hypothetical protein